MPNPIAPLSRRQFLGLAAGAAALGAGQSVPAEVPETSEAQWREAAQRIHSGALGEIWHGQVWAGVSSAPREDVPRQASEWRLGPAAASLYAPLSGLLLATGSGFPTRVSAAGGAWSGDDTEAPDAMVVTAEFCAGHTLVLTASPTWRHGIQAVIRGDKATLTFQNESVHVVRESRDIPQTGSPDTHQPHRLSAIRPLASDAELRRRTMTILAAAVEACRTRTAQHFDPESGSRI